MSDADEAVAPGTAVLAGASDAVIAHVRAGEGTGVDPAWLLTRRERARMRAFRDPADATDYLAAHLLVRLAAARVSGRPIGTLTVQQTCPSCGQVGHGPPRLAEVPRLHASLAHTRGYVVAAASTLAVGVDAERADRRFELVEVAEQVLTPAELGRVRAAPDPEDAALRLWVRKESLIKLGVATLDTASTVETPTQLPSADGVHESTWRGHAVLEWLAADAEGGPVALAAVCARRPDGVERIPGPAG